MVTEKAEKAWVSSRAAALAKRAGTHKHPTMPGFFMRVSPKLKAVWGYRFRDAMGNTQNGSLGQVAESGVRGGLSLDEAKEAFNKKHRTLKTASVGREMTLSDAYSDWMTGDRKSGGKRSDSTVKNYNRVFNRRLKPGYGDAVLAKSTAALWNRILEGIKKDSPGEARIAFWILRGVYRRFVDLGVLDKNVVDNATMKLAFSKTGGTSSRQTYIQAINLKTFLRGLDKVVNRGHGKNAIMCLLLTGWRLSCVLRLRWEQIDFETCIYDVRAYDVGWKGFIGPMAMNDYMLAYLLERKTLGGEAESEYVFPSYRGNTPYMQNVYGRMKKASKDLGWRVKPHDLRRTFTTTADVVLHGNQRLIGLLIAHSQPNAGGEYAGAAITGKYMIRNLPAEKESSRQVAEAILQICGMLPMDSELEALFKERGVDIEQLELIALPGDEDDDTGGEDSDEGTEVAVEAEGVAGVQVTEAIKAVRAKSSKTSS